MRILAILFTFFLLISCDDSHYKIVDLKNYNVSYIDLPAEVKNYLVNPIDAKIDMERRLIELPKGRNMLFRVETVNTWIGPWVSYEKLVNTDKNISYRIDQGMPSPYIVFDNKLYISKKFNLLSLRDDLSSIEFTCYILN